MSETRKRRGRSCRAGLPVPRRHVRQDLLQQGSPCAIRGDVRRPAEAPKEAVVRIGELLKGLAVTALVGVAGQGLAAIRRPHFGL